MSKSSVEVFEVGFEQLGELVGHSHRDDSGCEIGDYVLISTWICFGGGGHTVYTVFDSFKSLDDAADKQRYMFASDLYHMQHVAEMHAHDYEVWHVVDDAELWQMWEHDVEVSKAMSAAFEYHVMYQNREVVTSFVRPSVVYNVRAENSFGGIVVDSWTDDPIVFGTDLDSVQENGYKLGIASIDWSDVVTVIHDSSDDVDTVPVFGVVAYEVIPD